MKRTIFCAAVLSVAAVAASAAPALAGAGEGDPPSVQVAKEDRDFFDAAAQGGLLEVKLGQLVVAKGTSDDVKRFAQRMIDDHTKVDHRLADIGQKEGLSAPQELDKKQKDELDKMSQYSGTKLDQEYMNLMVDEHKDDVKAFEKEAKDGKDPVLKQFAATTLPTLNEHLALARQINDRIKK
jgi:putative membrane protein